MDVARQLHRIGADYMIAQNHPVSRMAVAHEKTVGADYRLFAVGRTQMDGGKLANNRAIADFNKRDRTVLIL